MFVCVEFVRDKFLGIFSHGVKRAYFSINETPVEYSRSLGSVRLLTQHTLTLMQGRGDESIEAHLWESVSTGRSHRYHERRLQTLHLPVSLDTKGSLTDTNVFVGGRIVMNFTIVDKRDSSLSDGN